MVVLPNLLKRRVGGPLPRRALRSAAGAAEEARMVPRFPAVQAEIPLPPLSSGACEGVLDVLVTVRTDHI